MKKEKQMGSKLIQCVLPKGKALQLAELLSAKGITRFGFSHARGFDIHDSPQKGGIPEQVEKEMVFIIAGNQSEADDLFRFVYEEANINCLGGGMIFMSSLNAATVFALPQILPKEAQSENEIGRVESAF